MENASGRTAAVREGGEDHQQPNGCQDRGGKSVSKTCHPGQGMSQQRPKARGGSHK